MYNYTIYTNQLYNKTLILRRTKFNAPLIYAVKCQVIDWNQEQVEDMKILNISLDLIIQLTLMNTPKKEHYYNNLHSMNEHITISSLYYGVMRCNR